MPDQGGVSKQTLPEDARVLIVLMGSIGDVARGLCLPAIIKSQIPGAKIHWLVEPKSAPLVQAHEGIDVVHLFNRRRWFSELFRIRRELRAYRFDAVLDMQRHAKSGLLSLLSGGKRRLGFHRRDAKEGNWLFSTEKVPAYGEHVSKLQVYLAFAEKLGLQVPRDLDFGLMSAAAKSPELPQFNLDTLAVPETKDRVIGIILGSSWKSKDWLPEGYQRLLQQLLQLPGSTVLLLGDRHNAELGRTLAAQHEGKRVVNLAGETTLAQMIPILSRCTLVIGPDSGPGHIAAALHIPYISLFGATDPTRTAPHGSEDLVLRSTIGCSPCYRKECPGLKRLCMRLISAEAVMQLVRSVLGENQKIPAIIKS